MKLIFITNDPNIALNCEKCGVDRVMVDLEIIGKEKRQGHLNTVISKHSMNDISNIRNILNKSDLLVRINPIHNDSSTEIEEVIKRGADVVMLPMFTTPGEVELFISQVDGRAKVNLLLETPQALVRINEILGIGGIDEIHIGLNDLHLGLGLKFMFEILSGGLIDYLSEKISAKGIPFGFGGVGRIREGLQLDPRLILSEHVRLKSNMVILSRDFHVFSSNIIEFRKETNKIIEFIKEHQSMSSKQLHANRVLLIKEVNNLCKSL